MIGLRIKDILLDQGTGEPHVILETEDNAIFFPLSIGPSEANAILVALEGIKVPRPLTHDLIVRFFCRHGFKIEFLEIYAFIENKYYARLWYKKGFKRYNMEIRPSDGLALVVRLGIPIKLQKGLLGLLPGCKLFIHSKSLYKNRSSAFGLNS
jgi:bifunctional DNase/RNase